MFFLKKQEVVSTPLTSLFYHTYLSVGKPGWEAVSKGGGGVGSQVGPSLSLHTGLFRQMALL